MLKFIRNINSGWILCLLGLTTILSGFSLNTKTEVTGTLLCFEVNCSRIQGISNICIGILVLSIGLYMVLKKTLKVSKHLN